MIICLLIPLGAASASDINNTAADDQVLSATPNVDTLSAGVNLEQENDTLSVQENEILAAGTDSGSNILKANDKSGTLSELYQIIQLSKGEIKLYKDYEYNSEDDLTQYTFLKDNIVIDGNNKTISSNSLVKFTFSGNNITLKNCIFTNIYLIINNGNIINSSFIDYNIGTGSSLFLTNVNLTGCIFDNYIQTYFIAFDVDSYCVISNCNFTGHTYTLSIDQGQLFYSLGKHIEFNYCNFKDYTYSKMNPNFYVFSFGRVANPIFNHCNFTNIKSRSNLFGLSNKYTLNYCNFTNISTNNRLIDASILNADHCNFRNISSFHTSLMNLSYCNFYQDNLNIDYGSTHTFNHCSFSDNATLTINTQYVNILDCEFKNIYTTISAPLTINRNYTTVESTSFRETSGSTNGAITVNDVLTNIFGNTYDTGSSLPNVTENVQGFDLYKFLYVSPTGNGNGRIDTEPCSLDYAFTHILSGGTVYFLEGIYDFDGVRDVAFNLERNGTAKVIINHGSIRQVNINQYIKGITFNNTSDGNYFGINSFGKLIDCNFTNIKSTVSYQRPTNSYLNTNALISLYDNAQANNIYFNNTTSKSIIIQPAQFSEIHGLTINGSVLSRVIAMKQDSYINTFEGITINDTTLNGYLCEGNFQWNPTYIRDVHLNNNTYNTGLFHKAYTGRNDGGGKTYIDGFYINGGTIKDNVILLDDFNHLTSGNLDRNIQYYHNLHVSNITTGTLINLRAYKTFEDCSFNNVTCSDSLINNAGDYYLIFNNVTFNHTTMSSIVNKYLDSYSFNRIIVNDSNFTSDIILQLKDGVILSNSAFNLYKGHIVVNGSKVSVSYSNFTSGNNSDLNGSSLQFINGNFLTIDTCRFIYNNASNGCVYLDNNTGGLKLVNNVFKNNSACADGHGGAIYIKPSGVSYAIDDKSLSGVPDESTSGDSYNAIYKVGSVMSRIDIYVANSTYLDSAYPDMPHSVGSEEDPVDLDKALTLVTESSKLIFIHSGDIFTTVDEINIIMDNIQFYGNNTTINGCEFVIDNDGVKLYNITLNNTQSNAIIWNGNNGLMDNCSIRNVEGANIKVGAGIIINGEHLLINRTTFMSNKALISGSTGGALYVNASNVDIKNCTFDNNYALSGSHIYVNENLENIGILNNTFSNSANNGIYIQGYNVVIKKNIFSNNTGVVGAALTIAGDVFNLDVNNNMFESNVASTGGLYISFTNMLSGQNNIVDNIFMRNNASQGGALYISSQTMTDNLIIEKNTFDYNSATQGGAVFVDADGVILRNSTFTGNNATYGGALYVVGNKNYLIECDFIRNNALFESSQGSAIYIDDNKTFYMDHVFLNDNHVYEDSLNPRGDISYAGILPSIIGDSLTLGDNQVMLNRVDFLKYDLVYVSLIEKGIGYSANTATTCSNALEGILPNGIIYIVDREFTIDMDIFNKFHEANLTNVTIVGFNKTKITRDTNTGKYLFILPIWKK